MEGGRTAVGTAIMIDGGISGVFILSIRYLETHKKQFWRGWLGILQFRVQLRRVNNVSMEVRGYCTSNKHFHLQTLTDRNHFS